MFSRASFERTIRDSDLDSSTEYVGTTAKRQLAIAASVVAAEGFDNLQLKPITIRKKTAHIVSDLATRIVLRRLNSTITRSTKIRAADRDTIVRRLHTILTEGVTHRIYKFDIRSFFESVDVDALATHIHADLRIPRTAALLTRQFLEKSKNLGVTGVARGLALSATLAEYSMLSFDQALSQSPHVYFYARYVDDIIIVTGARETERSFLRFATKKLPPGLRFNGEKQRVINLPAKNGGVAGTTLGTLDYLGYEFKFFPTHKKYSKIQRTVDVRIAESKLRRLKSRICRSFAAFLTEKDTQLLEQRMKMLSGNYNIRDQVTKQVRNVGLYCNYRRVTDTSQLDDINSLMKSLLVGNKSRLSKKLSKHLSKKDRQKLLKFDYHASFRERTFYNFDVIEMNSLSKCWNNA